MLSLHDRVAIVLPDKAFAQAFGPALSSALLDAFGTAETEAARRFKLIDATQATALATTPSARAGRGEEWLIVDTVSAFDGLERLIVIAVALDAVIADVRGAATLETRSRLYRALTRAHMMAVVVNEFLAGGFFAFLGHVSLKGDKKFDRAAAAKQLNHQAVDAITKGAAAKAEQQESSAQRTLVRQATKRLERQHAEGVATSAAAGGGGGIGRVTGTMSGEWMTGRTFDGVDGVAHARDPTLYIFAVHDDGHTKMAGWRIASVSATPVWVDGRVHEGSLKPIDADSISDTWDAAAGRTIPDANYKVRNIRLHASPSMRFSAAHEGKYLGGYAADRGKKHATLEEAQAACLADPSAGGVTKEREDAYTVRKGAELQDSPSGETSWIKLPPHRAVGKYECTMYKGTENWNTWHTVEISEGGTEGILKWSNLANVTWTLYGSGQSGELEVGSDCPYFKDGHTQCKLVQDPAGNVIAVMGPWNERYDRVVPSSSPSSENSDDDE